MIDQDEARTAIQRVQILYTHLIDDLRMDEWGELFSDDATWTFGEYHFVGRKNIVFGVGAMEPPKAGAVRHITYPPILEFETDCVYSWANATALVVKDEASPIVAVGRYYDVMRQSDGRWRFFTRLFVPSGEFPPPGVRLCPGF